MAMTVIFVKLLHKEFSKKVLCVMLSQALCPVYKDDRLIRGARLVCSPAILENVVLRKTFGVLLDSFNS